MISSAALSQRRLGHIWALGLLVVAPVITVVVIARTWYSLSVGCPGYDDEGIIRAPRSWQGLLVCSDGGYGDPRIATLSLLAIVFWATAATVWFRTRKVGLVTGLLVAAIMSPAVVAASFSTLPADCSTTQKNHYGEHGCERDREMRTE